MTNTASIESRAQEANTAYIPQSILFPHNMKLIQHFTNPESKRDCPRYISIAGSHWIRFVSDDQSDKKYTCITMEAKADINIVHFQIAQLQTAH